MSDGTTLANAYINLIPSLRGAQKTIAKDLGADAVGRDAGKKIGGGIASGIKSLVGPAVAIAATAAIAKFATDSVRSLGRIEEINAQTAAAIKSTGESAGVTAKHVEGLAGQLENLTGTEAESIQQGANLLLTFKNIRNEAGEGNDVFDQTVRAMTDMGRAMGTEPKAGAIQLGKALNDPIKGIAALSRVGITFTKDQEAMIRSMVESGDVMGAQKTILNELNSQFGGSGAAYAETYAGRMELLGHAMGTFGEAVMTVAMPALTDFARVGADVFNGMAAWFEGDTWTGFAAQVSAVTGQVGDVLSGMWATAGPVLAEFGSGLMDTFREFAPVVGAALAPLGDAFKALSPTLAELAPVVGQVLAAFSPLGLALKTLGPVLPQIVEAVASLATQAFGVLAPMLAQVAPLLTQLASTIATGLGQALTTVVPILLQVAQALLPIVLQVVSALLPVAMQLVTTIVALLPTVMALVTPLLSVVQALLPIVGIVGNLISTLLPPLIDLFMGLLTPILGLIGPLASSLVPIIESLATVISSALVPYLTVLVSVLGAVIGTVVKVAGPILGGLVKAFTEIIKVVVKVAAGIAGFAAKAAQLMSGFVSGVVSGIGSAVGWFQSLPGKIKGVFSAAGSWLRGAGSTVIKGLQTGVTSAWNGVVTFFKGIPGKIKGFFSGAGTALYQAGRDTINGLLNGAGSLLSSIGNFFLSKLPGWIQGPFKKALGIASPSKVFKRYGKNLVEGLVIGVSQDRDKLRTATDKLGDVIAAAGEKAIARETDRLIKARKKSNDRIKAFNKTAAKGQKKDLLPTLSKADAEKRAKRNLSTELAASKKARALVNAQEKTTRAIWKNGGNAGADRIVASITKVGNISKASGLRGTATLADVALARENIGSRLAAANENLANLQDSYTQLRDSIANSIKGELDLAKGITAATADVTAAVTQSYGSNGSWTQGGAAKGSPAKATFASVAGQVKSLATKARAFALKLAGLARKGIPSGLVQEVASLGTEQGSVVADALLTGTSAQVRGLQNDYASLNTWSTKAGSYVADQMYGAGIDAAEGLIKGLEAADNKLAKAANRMGQKLIDAVKRKLGIKSPSRAFRDQVGLMITAGVTAGLDKGQPALDRRVGALVQIPDVSATSPSTVAIGSDPLDGRTLYLVVDGKPIRAVVTSEISNQATAMAGGYR